MIVFLLMADILPYRNFAITMPLFTQNTDEQIERRIDWVHKNAAYDRILFDTADYPFGLLTPNSCLPREFYSVDSFEPFPMRQWTNYVRSTVGEKDFDLINEVIIFSGWLQDDLLSLLIRNARMAGLASLRYFITSDPLDSELRGSEWRLEYQDDLNEPTFYVYENTTALPRVYLVNDYEIAASEKESLSLVKENISRLSTLAILENGSPSFPRGAAARPPGQAAIRRYEGEEVEVHVEAETPSILILTDNYYPGWVAFVDGVEKDLWRANSLFRAVEAPAGAHTVLFQYHPASVRWGIFISLLTGTLVVAGLLIERRHARSHPGRRQPDLEPVV
jgi:hypothetical protein